MLNVEKVVKPPPEEGEGERGEPNPNTNSEQNDQDNQQEEVTVSSSTALSLEPPPTAKVIAPPVLPLDWTNLAPDPSEFRPVRYPSDVMDFPNDETYLEIIGTAGQKITFMGKDLMKRVSPDITHLVLRSHLILKMEGIRGMKELELLELYDNQIEYLEELEGEEGEGDNDDCRGTGFNLKTMDMSYNVIRGMKPVHFCPNLVELYLANNKIKVMEGLSSLVHLRKIDLGANRIRFIDAEQLSGLVNLEELWLGKNKIEKIEGLSTLTKLRRLDVQSNRLTSVSGLIGQIDCLEELYLAHNGIDDDGAMLETGLKLQFQNLTTLDLSKNRLKSCKPFCHLDSLNELWLSENKVASFEDVQPLSRLGTRDGAELTEIYLEHNPIYKDFEYRKKLKEIIPSLKQIDANIIGGTGYGSIDVKPMSAESVLEQMKMVQNKIVARAEAEAEKLNTGDGDSTNNE